MEAAAARAIPRRAPPRPRGLRRGRRRRSGRRRAACRGPPPRPRGLAVFVAVVDGEVVGYAKLRGHPDGRSADHGMTAVKRAWRGRGIAKSLKLAEIAWAKANGIERLTTSNEERNAAMLRINE